MKSKKILYGVCGIGMGHTYRQLPLLDELAKDNRIVLFVYGESKSFYEEHFRHSENVTVLTVSVPFYVGNAQGLDFAETARRIAASGIDHEAINLAAMEKTQELIGKPDLVISDYEPISAQYAYASGTPLVTIDQQSKYLVGDYDQELAGQTCLDEVARLRLFFPAAALRLACSFFTVPRRSGKSGTSEKVIICPPIIKPAIVAIKKRRRLPSRRNPNLEAEPELEPEPDQYWSTSRRKETLSRATKRYSLCCPQPPSITSMSSSKNCRSICLQCCPATSPCVATVTLASSMCWPNARALSPPCHTGFGGDVPGHSRLPDSAGGLRATDQRSCRRRQQLRRLR
jgi:hypothetical protein